MEKTFNYEIIDLASPLFAQKNPSTGKLIQFPLRPGQALYLFYKGPRGEFYCYSPHPDTDGNFWCWTYQPIGQGSRSGKAKQWKLIQLVRCAKRKTAKSKALHRFHLASRKVMR